MHESLKGAAPSAQDFFKSLEQSGLLTPDEMNRTLSELRQLTLPLSAKVYADQLVTAGRLTSFQAEALLDRRVDDLLLGNYEVLSRLGGGGMGTVYRARHRRMKRVVALKVLTQGVAKDPTFLQRFQREVETVARLTHPNIVMAYDADESSMGPFLVMEFVDGTDLATRIAQQGPSTIHEAIDWILQSARGLAYAHAQGMVHRDIKPANLLLDTLGVVKVTDMGLARFNESRTQQDDPYAMTQAGSVLGTVDYMAPEQAVDSTAIDHRADIYSLGCTLYFLLTGSPPFVGQSLMATLLKHRDAAIPSLHMARPDAPVALEVLFRRMLAKRPEDRSASMQDIVAALEAIQKSLVHPPRAVPSAQSSPIPEDSGSKTIMMEPPMTAVQKPPSTVVQSTTTPTMIMPPVTDATTGTVVRVPAVLLVEPSRAQSVIVKNYLRDLGFENVQTVSSAESALQALRTSPTDVVLSAMHLSDTTGIELARQMRAEPALTHCGLVIVTSEADSTMAQEVMDLPGVVLLLKPFDLLRLKQAVADAAPRGLFGKS